MAASLTDYLREFNWSETDVLLVRDFWEVPNPSDARYVSPDVSILAFGTSFFEWADKYAHANRLGQLNHMATFEAGNTERELTVGGAYPAVYRELVNQLTNELGRSNNPPQTVKTSSPGATTLITTTSGSTVALRVALPKRGTERNGPSLQPIALFDSYGFQYCCLVPSIPH